MLRTLLYSFLLFTLWALFGRWYYVCHIRGCACCETGVNAASIASNLRLSKEGSADILRGYEQFSFAVGSGTPDLSNNNQKFLAETAAYLKAHSDESLTITACSRANENATLGEQRATALRDALVKLGINGTQVKLAGCVSDSLLSTAASFNLSGANTSVATVNTATATTNEVAPKKDDYLNISISDENFAFNSATFQPNQDFINKANQLKTYVASKPNVSIDIVGHTDNIGNDDFNMQLGQRRADAVKEYFQQNGVKIKISSSSKGETAPIASNDSKEGRAKNRRVTCKVIQ